MNSDARTSAASPPASPIIRARDKHTLSRRLIDPDALKVLYRLHHTRYKAYLVGGGVRDLLLGRSPKDFDVATDAHPRDVKRLFRNCFIIGRRFRLAHVKFGDKAIEVSTFRRLAEGNAPEDGDHFQHRDNTFGTPEEDARRRDFTINALFYDISTFGVIDHVGGLEDLDRRVIRSIGDPNIRFLEDPVRMVRAVRLASRLGFTIEPGTYEAILRHREEIRKAAPQRLLEEVYRLFGFHSAEAAFRLLRQTQLMSVMLPELERILGRDEGAADRLWRCLGAVDQGRMGTPDPAPLVMLGSLLYLPFTEHRDETAHEGQEVPDFEKAHLFLKPIALRYQIPKSVFWQLCHVFDLQRGLDALRDHSGGSAGRRFSPSRFARHEAFADALTLYAVRVAGGEGDPATLEEWRRIAASAGAVARPPAEIRGPDRRPRRRRGRRGAASARGEGTAAPAKQAEPAKKPGRWRFLAKFPFLKR